MYLFSNKSKSNLVGLHPEIGFMFTEAIKISTMDFMLFEGVRTMQRQRYLYATGASKTLDSYHLYGLAGDAVPTPASNNHKPTWEEEYFPPMVAAIKDVIKTHGLTVQWGFDLWEWDMAHFQMSGFKNSYDVRKLDPKVCKCG